MATLPSRAAVDLAAALRLYAEGVDGVRGELRDADDRSYDLARRLDLAGELIRVLARLVEGKTMHEAFGAPGDFGYETKIGAALARYYGVSS